MIRSSLVPTAPRPPAPATAAEGEGVRRASVCVTGALLVLDVQTGPVLEAATGGAALMDGVCAIPNSPAQIAPKRPVRTTATATVDVKVVNVCVTVALPVQTAQRWPVRETATTGSVVSMDNAFVRMDSLGGIAQKEPALMAAVIEGGVRTAGVSAAPNSPVPTAPRPPALTTARTEAAVLMGNACARKTSLGRIAQKQLVQGTAATTGNVRTESVFALWASSGQSAAPKSAPINAATGETAREGGACANVGLPERTAASVRRV